LRGALTNYLYKLRQFFSRPGGAPAPTDPLHSLATQQNHFVHVAASTWWQISTEPGA